MLAAISSTRLRPSSMMMHLVAEDRTSRRGWHEVPKGQSSIFAFCSPYMVTTRNVAQLEEVAGAERDHDAPARLVTKARSRLETLQPRKSSWDFPTVSYRFSSPEGVRIGRS